MKALLAMLDLGRRQAVGDRDPIRHWHKGRVVLLGDAAHPTAAVAGAGRLHGDRGRALPGRLHRTPPTATSRRPSGGTKLPAMLRTARVTLESRYSGTSTTPDGITRDVLLADAGRASDEADTFQCLAWLYDGFCICRPRLDAR